jgi:hypothetical protein
MKKNKKRLLERIVNQRAKLIESYSWERKPGGPLPTLEDTMAKHQKAPVNEAPMDNRFSKEWERNCKVLITHLEHEQKGKLGAHKGTVKKMIDTLRTVKGYPDLMAHLFGTN